MLKSFSEIKKNLKLKFTVNIDNIVFKCHYKLTTLILFTFTVLVCSKHYVGEHIHCNLGEKDAKKEFLKVVSTYCFSMGTYSVLKYYNSTLQAPHPGVGPHLKTDELKHHVYYQWVPYVLFLQALLFYVPHYIWRAYDNGRLKLYVNGLELLVLSTQTTETKFKTYPNGEEIVIPSKPDRDKKLESLSNCFKERLGTNNGWAFVLILCEILNFINVVGNIYLTDTFLGGAFTQYGPRIVNFFMNEESQNGMDPFDMAFPKVTKCSFQKYGPSGQIQIHHAICVLALNAVNEKIYVFLWFWFLILAIFSGFAIVWRIINRILYSKSETFNSLVFSAHSQVSLSRSSIQVLTYRCNFGDWLFLRYLSKNMNGLLFKHFIDTFTARMNNRGHDILD